VTDKNYDTKVINLRRKRLVRKYKALFELYDRVVQFFHMSRNKALKSKNYKKTINH
jgi:hypothetical protein